MDALALLSTTQACCYGNECRNELESPFRGDLLTERISRKQTTLILLAIAFVGFAVAIIGYGNLIAGNCDSSGAYGFFSAFRDFHTEAGCSP